MGRNDENMIEVTIFIISRRNSVVGGPRVNVVKFQQNSCLSHSSRCNLISARNACNVGFCLVIVNE